MTAILSFNTRLCSRPVQSTHPSNIWRLMAGEEQEPMLPWWCGFKGTIKKADCKYYVTGIAISSTSPRSGSRSSHPPVDAEVQGRAKSRDWRERRRCGQGLQGTPR
ncbi:hypothetical protein BC826DRAFT_54329 [Russula brevipes]|nr:hypothetical protein BC826DRAFT_74001 [Russula brevipes]KAI0287324.1 hypothetical protein BC826DRAFT_54329 [Russula brevipes]